ncbi:MAG: tetratricopeptide repeat protein [Eubacteriales bacterium]|nr:tetratricopeptide repeat protein [Eubacteriales bacterium]
MSRKQKEKSKQAVYIYTEDQQKLIVGTFGVVAFLAVLFSALFIKIDEDWAAVVSFVLIFGGIFAFLFWLNCVFPKTIRESNAAKAGILQSSINETLVEPKVSDKYRRQDAFDAEYMQGLKEELATILNVRQDMQVDDEKYEQAINNWKAVYQKQKKKWVLGNILRGVLMIFTSPGKMVSPVEFDGNAPNKMSRDVALLSYRLFFCKSCDQMIEKMRNDNDLALTYAGIFYNFYQKYEPKKPHEEVWGIGPNTYLFYMLAKATNLEIPFYDVFFNVDSDKYDKSVSFAKYLDRIMKSGAYLRNLPEDFLKKTCDYLDSLKTANAEYERRLNIIIEKQPREAKKRVIKEVLRVVASFSAIPLTIALILGLAENVIDPHVEYKQALTLLQNGQYDEATKQFSYLPKKYKDKHEYEWYYAMGTSYQEAEDYLNAADCFSTAGFYQDSRERYIECSYNAGVKAQEAGKYAQAATEFEKAGNYKDSRERYQDSMERYKEWKYNEGIEYLQAGDYLKAADMFEALSDYQDSKERYIESIYNAGIEYQKAGEYSRALSEFEDAGDYKDSKERCRECRYSQAEEYEEAGKYDLAATEFENLGDYKDSRERYQDSKERYKEWRYDRAVNFEESGNYSSAESEFENLGDYKDSKERLKVCKYNRGVKYVEFGDYSRAADMFEELSDYQDSKERYRECKYNQAVEYEEAGKYDLAATEFGNVVDYKDSKERLKECRYSAGVEYQEAGNYWSAESEFKNLGDYKDSKERLKECRYSAGVEYQEAGNYSSAESEFENLGDYKDSKERLKECKYNRAVKFEEAGNYELAAFEFDGAGDYKDSKERYIESSYNAGVEYQNAGEYYSAAYYFENAGDYKDSRERLKECRDQSY